MSMFIAPEDQDIDTVDAVLRLAWTDRRQLRLEEAQLRAKIKALDTFIATYVERANPVFKQKLTQIGISYPVDGRWETMPTPNPREKP